MWRRLYGDRHREVMISTQTLAGVLAQGGTPNEAEPLFRDALSMARALFGDTHLLVLAARRALASFLEKRGRLDEALAEREAELAAAKKLFGDGPCGRGARARRPWRTSARERSTSCGRA